MNNTIFKYKNPNPATYGPAPDPNKPRYIKAVINEEEIHEQKRFVVSQNATNHEPIRRFVLKEQRE